jgi:hypothetical protein
LYSEHFGLIKDYNRDRGQNVKAKIFHTICLIILIGSYAGSFRIVGMLIRDFEGAKQRFSVDVGFVSAQTNWILFLVHSAVVLTVLILAYTMITRSEKSRRGLVMVLPLAGVLEVYGFYSGWITQTEDLGLDHTFIILMGLVVVGSITTFLLLVYTSGFMKTFFAFGSGDNSAQECQPIDHSAGSGVTNSVK